MGGGNPEIETIENPSPFLNGKNNYLVGNIRQCFESLGLQSLSQMGKPLRSLHKIFAHDK